MKNKDFEHMPTINDVLAASVVVVRIEVCLIVSLEDQEYLHD